MRTIKENRDFMKSSICDKDINATSDIACGVPQPPFQKSVSENDLIMDLPNINSETAPKADFFTCIHNRISRRLYSSEPLSLFELSFML